MSHQRGSLFPEGGRVSINQMTIMLQEGGTIVADKSGDVKVSAESMILSGDNAPMISLDGTVACVVHSDGSVTLPNGGIVTSTNAFCDSVTISALTDHEENQSDANVVMA